MVVTAAAVLAVADAEGMEAVEMATAAVEAKAVAKRVVMVGGEMVEAAATAAAMAAARADQCDRIERCARPNRWHGIPDCRDPAAE